MGWALVFIMRLLVPLSIIRFPLAGGIVAIIADNLDWHILHTFPPVDYFSYQRYDKFLDTYYLTIEFFISLTWKEKFVRLTSIVLFLYRVTGVAIFELTNKEYLLFIFPNLFEGFYLFYLLHKKFIGTNFSFRNAYVATSLFLLTIGKIIIEYFIHILKTPITDFFLTKISPSIFFLPK